MMAWSLPVPWRRSFRAAGGYCGGAHAQRRSSFNGGESYRQVMRSVQRGRGPSGGRVPSKRGRMRKRGPSGGGTLRRNSPQEGQRPSLATGPATSALNQCPRASHSGLMHCTVKPGRYCIASPQGPQGPFRGAAAVPKENAQSKDPLALITNQGPRGNSAFDGAFCPQPSLVSSGKHRKILW